MSHQSPCARMEERVRQFQWLKHNATHCSTLQHTATNAHLERG